jgi:hypothetical protein
MPVGSDYYVIPRVIYKASNPTISDDINKGVEVGQEWVNTTTKDIFYCIDNTSTAARWYKSVFQLDPLETTVPSYQTEINNAVANKTFFITPEVMYYNSDTIAYDLTIPVASNAVSMGPMSISPGFTVTVNGTWTIW